MQFYPKHWLDQNWSTITLLGAYIPKMIIEAVPRRATKMLPGLKNMSYPDRLKALQLPTLIYCRLRGDCIQVYKYLYGHYDVNCSNLMYLNNSVE